MDDNIFDDGDDQDFRIEQRSTDRHMQEIYSSGYRDAYQECQEDEKLLQAGFDHSYKLFVKIGFLIGQIRSVCNYVKDSSSLARVNHRLEIIEKKCAYEKLVKWREDGEIDLSDLISKLASIESRLGEFRAILSHDKSKMNEFLSLLDLEDGLACSSVEDQTESGSNNTNQLNKMIKSLEF